MLGVVALLVYGCAGYIVLEHYSPLDALFMTVITITTVGYGEVKPLDVAGEVFTMTVILLGVLGVLYTFGVLVEVLSNGRWREYRRVRRMDAAIDALNNHIIVCGYGRTGQQVVRELRNSGESYVVVEKNDDGLEAVTRDGELHIVGDATHDDSLQRAGIRRARALISAVDSDERAVYIALSARTLNPDIYIVARASYPETEPKLARAGADRVVSPYTLSGRRMAALAVQPAAVDAVELVMRGGGGASLRIEELEVSNAEQLSAGRLRESGAALLAVRANDGRLLIGPTDDEAISRSDLIVAMGTREQLSALAGMLEPLRQRV